MSITVEMLDFRLFFLSSSSCGGSSEKLSVAQAESCQVGSTVFPLEFISPTTYGKGRFTCLSRNEKRREEKRRTRKLLNLWSFSISLLVLFVDGLTQEPGLDLSQRSTPPFKVATDLLQVIKKANSEERAGQIVLNVGTCFKSSLDKAENIFTESIERKTHTYTHI